MKVKNHKIIPKPHCPIKNIYKRIDQTGSIDSVIQKLYNSSATCIR